jgi:hypothetical protein
VHLETWLGVAAHSLCINQVCHFGGKASDVLVVVKRGTNYFTQVYKF